VCDGAKKLKRERRSLVGSVLQHDVDTAGTAARLTDVVFASHRARGGRIVLDPGYDCSDDKGKTTSSSNARTLRAGLR
jgi:hypothetical protein